LGAWGEAIALKSGANGAEKVEDSTLREEGGMRGEKASEFNAGA
jgi:hypothetical protein